MSTTGNIIATETRNAIKAAKRELKHVQVLLYPTDIDLAEALYRMDRAKVEIEATLQARSVARSATNR